MEPTINELIHRIEQLEARVTELEGRVVEPIKPDPRPCSMEELLAYAIEIGLPKAEALHFNDHFASNGWKVANKAPMKDWKAALRNWERNYVRYKLPKIRGSSAVGDEDLFSAGSR